MDSLAQPSCAGEEGSSCNTSIAGANAIDLHANLADVFLPGILDRIAGFLPANEVAGSLRLVNRAIAAQLRQHAAISLSRPVPRHAFAARWSAPGACHSLTFKQRVELLSLTAASGDLVNLEVAFSAVGLVLSAEAASRVLEAAAGAGQLAACRLLLERGCRTSYSSLDICARAGQREACEWVLANGARWTASAVAAAAGRGHLELMRWLLEQRPEGLSAYWPSAMALIVEGCDLTALQQLWAEHGGAEMAAWEKEAALAAAAGSRTPDWAAKLDWLLAAPQDCVVTPLACAVAAAGPDAVARLTHLHTRLGFPVDERAVASAVRVGNTQALSWLLSQGVRPVDEGAAVVAATHGQLGALQALHAAGCQVDPEWALYRAADGGYVAVATWLLDTFGAEAVSPRCHVAAARAGSREILELLRARGFEWSEVAEEVWRESCEAGCAEVLQWLCEHWGQPLPTEDELRLYALAASYGDLATLGALRRLGFPLDPSAFPAAIEGGAPVEALAWLLEAGVVVDWGEAQRAAEGRAEVREWLRRQAGGAGAEGGAEA